METRRYSTSAKALDQVVDASRLEAGGLFATVVPERNAVLFRLLVLNILLQVFDGVATYSGLHFGIREGNPLLRNAFSVWGVVPTLLVLKVNAGFLLFFIYRFARERLSMPALIVLGGVYSVFSLFPWLAMFLHVLTR